MKLKREHENKSIIVGILIFLLLFVGLGFAIFKLGLGHFVAKSYENARDKDYIHQLRLLSLFAGVLFAISCSVAGFFVAKKRGRNKVKWIILCFFFNLWGLIILLLLPRKEKS